MGKSTVKILPKNFKFDKNLIEKTFLNLDDVEEEPAEQQPPEVLNSEENPADGGEMQDNYWDKKLGK